MLLSSYRISPLLLLALLGFADLRKITALPTPVGTVESQSHQETELERRSTSISQKGPVLEDRASSVNWWVPTQKTTWQVQLSGTIDRRFKGNAIEFDADTDAATVKYFKSKGIKTIAYISAGSWENWRSDAKKFPKSVIGKPLDGWPGESWLDTRQINTLKPLMQARLNVAKAKGFDGVDWDNVDGYTQNSGFKITAAHQIAYNRMLADISHAQRMTVALKNDLGQAAALAPYFDFAVNEQCGYYQECNLLEPFLKAGKAVVGLEYPGEGDDKRTYAQVKARTDPRTYTLIKKLDLGAWGIVVSTKKSVLS
ncbi:hypothetical protein TWF696_002924 [Orbilia brochopaga]|uniref:alpha-galactosidase n=1 Tax=Orbilia brochopaga TaxID=3140254 RepID=A0AAV9U4V1_9PEZI